MTDCNTLPSTFEVLQTAQTALVNSELKKDAAWKAYSEAIDDYQRGYITHAKVEQMADNAAALEAQASVLWRSVESAKADHLAYLAAQEEFETMCDCTPIYTCPICTSRAHNSEIEY